MSPSKFALLLPALALTLVVSVWSYEITSTEVIWTHGQTIDEGVQNLESKILRALRYNQTLCPPDISIVILKKKSAVNPTKDAARDFFEHLQSIGRLTAEGEYAKNVRGQDWNEWYAGVPAKHKKKRAALQLELERQAGSSKHTCEARELEEAPSPPQRGPDERKGEKPKGGIPGGKTRRLLGYDSPSNYKDGGEKERSEHKEANINKA
ncbi:uncharacterized protein SPSC_06631 [Sporisorium scitamineum]|uniref:Uncharacterized protein n=1 Tax=Sporisorium scitamineum TaxID=49012 RepID=A0A140KNR2_9BASI|nr:uncharacterized protein SPSC_06631 [Sporisorium scitamineum]